MPLDPDVLNEIDGLVRGGFEDRDRIVEIVCEELHEPGELDQADVTAAVDTAFAAHEKEKDNWPLVTDCDKLDRVFEALNSQGILALQNAGYTQSDGFDDVQEQYQSQSEKGSIGYCFYHGQDLERALRGQGLFLAFGPIDAEKEETEGPRIGARIVEELQRSGFNPRWNGTFAQRILIPELDWKRRGARNNRSM